jgi:hypothetical protein
MPTATTKEPVLGMILAACVPGLGHGYVGAWPTVILVVTVAAALVFVRAWWMLGAFHVFQLIAARGAVLRWNAQHAADLSAPVPPPTRPTTGSGR